MREKIRSLIKKGFFHIFGANVINRIIQFASSIFLVRLLSKEQFGLFSYAQNILMFFLLFNGLGVNAGMLQYGSESIEEDKRNSFFNYGIKIGISFNLFVCIFVLIYSNFFSIKIEDARPILSSMFLFPLFMFLFELLQIYFRSSLENKKFSFFTTLNTFLLFIFSVIGAYYFQIIGVVVFRYLAYIITMIVGLILVRSHYIDIFKSSVLVKTEKKEFMKFSIVSSFNSAISQLLYVIDIFLIGLILVDENTIASYKTATLIPFALNFIPLSIMMFIYPYFARNNTNKKWIKQNYLKLTKYLIIINFAISLFLVVFAPSIIKILFGAEYYDSIIPFRILSFGYFVAATFRIPAGNVLVMLKKVKFGMYLSIITGVLNILLDIVLIKFYGAVGAAIATLVVFIFTSVAGIIYLAFILTKQSD